MASRVVSIRLDDETLKMIDDLNDFLYEKIKLEKSRSGLIKQSLKHYKAALERIYMEEI